MGMVDNSRTDPPMDKIMDSHFYEMSAHNFSHRLNTFKGAGITHHFHRTFLLNHFYEEEKTDKEGRQAQALPVRVANSQNLRSYSRPTA